MKKLLLFVCLGAGAVRAYDYLQERRAVSHYMALQAPEVRNRPASRHGFRDAFQPDGVDPFVVTVLIPCGCSPEAGQRGEVLASKIKAAHIPVTSTSTINATFKFASDAEFDAKMAQMNRLMNGEPPIVLYKGRAKSNPSFEDVVAEYRASP